jgi:fusion and transport protein UGO1
MPLFFRQWLRIDPIHTPGAYSVTSFLTSLSELFVKLPLETVLRRGHVAVLSGAINVQPSRRPGHILPLHTGVPGLNSQRFKPIVPTGPYRGVVGSILYIIYEEGRAPQTVPSTPVRASSSLSNRRPDDSRRKVGEKRGQGLKGLWRGWRVGFWGIVGSYAVAGLGPGPSAAEF